MMYSKGVIVKIMQIFFLILFNLTNLAFGSDARTEILQILRNAASAYLATVEGAKNTDELNKNKAFACSDQLYSSLPEHQKNLKARRFERICQDVRKNNGLALEFGTDADEAKITESEADRIIVAISE